MKILVGILAGIFITFALLLGYRRIINPYYAATVPHFVTDTSKKVIAQGDLIELKNQNLSSIEKIEAVNKRLDDLLIFGTIIITLLLAINVSVYVNTERQVEKYFRENFEDHKKRVLKSLQEVEEIAGKIKAEFELTQDIQKKGQPVQTPS